MIHTCQVTSNIDSQWAPWNTKGNPTCMIMGIYMGVQYTHKSDARKMELPV